MRNEARTFYAVKQCLVALLPLLSCPNCLVLSGLSFSGWQVRSTFKDRQVLAILSWLSRPECLAMAVLKRLSHLGYPVPAVTSLLSCSCRPIISFLSWLYYLTVISGCPSWLSDPAFLSCLSSPRCPVPAVLLQQYFHQLSCRRCPVFGIMSSVSCPCILTCKGWPVRPTCPDCLVPGFLSRLFPFSQLASQGCTVPAVLSQLSCSGCPLQAVLVSFLSLLCKASLTWLFKNGRINHKWKKEFLFCKPESKGRILINKNFLIFDLQLVSRIDTM